MSPLRETPLGFLFSKVRGPSAFDLTVGWFVASWISPLVPQLRRNVRQGISLLHPLGLEGGSPLNLLKPLILSPLRGSLPRSKNANHFLPGGLLRFSPWLRFGVTSFCSCFAGPVRFANWRLPALSPSSRDGERRPVLVPRGASSRNRHGFVFCPLCWSLLGI